MKNVKRFFAMLLAVTTVICPMNVFAMEPTDGEQTERQETAIVEQTEQQETAIVETGEAAVTDATTLAAGKVLASAVGTIHGTGTLTVYLPSGNWFADFVAGISYTAYSGIVSCSVLTPDGKTFDLGSISGSGSRTSSHQETYAPAGNYKVQFFSSVPEFEAYVTIYD